MGCGMYYPFRTRVTKRKSGIYFSTSTYLIWIAWNYISRVSIRFLRKKNTWFRKWHVRSVSEEHFFICSSSEGTGIGAADRNWTWGLCYHHDYSSFQLLWLFGGDFEPFEVSQTKWSSGGECCRMTCWNICICWETWELMGL